MLVTGAGKGAHDMKEGDIVDENEPSTSSTPREQERAAIIKLAKDMAPLCSIYDMDFRTLSEKYRSGVRERLS